jgi:hypothetical protein
VLEESGLIKISRVCGSRLIVAVREEK